MLAARHGNRTRLYRYLLGLAGIDTKLVVMRRFGAPEPGPLPNGNLYPGTLLLVEPDGAAPVYLWGEDRGAPFRYIPAGFYGQAGVVLEEGFREVTIPDPGLEVDRRTIDVDAQIGPGGAATLSVVERNFGAQAIGWRERLERIPEADLERVMGEAYVPQVLPGGVLTSVAFEGLDDPEAPVVLRYSAQVASFGRETGGARRLPSLFATDLAPLGGGRPLHAHEPNRRRVPRRRAQRAHETILRSRRAVPRLRPLLSGGDGGRARRDQHPALMRSVDAKAAHRRAPRDPWPWA